MEEITIEILYITIVYFKLILMFLSMFFIITIIWYIIWKSFFSKINIIKEIINSNIKNNNTIKKKKYS